MTEREILDDLKDVLNQWVGRKILITKEENGDIDQTLLEVEHLQQEIYDHKNDDYLSQTTVQLVGNGQIVSNGENTALPYGSFDIPFDDAQEIHIDVEGVFLRTSRAVYTFTPV